MQNGVVLLALMVFLCNFQTLGDGGIEEQPTYPSYKEYSGYVEVNIKGAIPIEATPTRTVATETEVGNIPLRMQLNYSCGTTSLAMMMDWLGEPYRSQTFYDDCSDREIGETTQLYQLKRCSDKLGIKTEKDLNYPLKKVKTGDIVLYHVLNYKNESDMHASVVDSIDSEIIRIANPWNTYDEYTVEEFRERYTREALIVGD